MAVAVPVASRERLLPAVGRRLGPACAAHAVSLLGWTLRLSVVGTETLRPFWSGARPLIYVMWHGRILMAPWLNARLRASHGARRVTVLASRSRDGELVVRYAARFGLPSVRGSSSRGGAAAVRALTDVLRRGEDVIIVPDGPRGPGGRVQPGVVVLAALAGTPIVPVAFAARPAVRLGSWDRFIVPLPCARAAAVFGPPVPITRHADREAGRQEVEAALARVTTRADDLVRSGA